MSNEIIGTPNTTSAVPAENAIPSLDSIAQKMTAMRNQNQATNGVETGSTNVATEEAPVAPDENSESDVSSVGPEVDDTNEQVDDNAQEDSDAPDEVSTQDSQASDIIDFLEFAETNPDAKFKFMRNGKEVIIDAKKAAAILGQGGAIHEEARELKVQKAEFDEYVKDKQATTEGLILAMEFTVQPQIQKAYDEIVKTQNYQNTFQQQLVQATQMGDIATATRIKANMEQNERWIAQQSNTIQELKPRVDEFYKIRQQQVASVLDDGRKQFKDKELKNEYVYNELRNKISKGWESANHQLVVGIPNIDLVSSDEHIMSLLRDGLKYREKPASKSSGSSIAALTTKRSGISNSKTQEQANISNLQELASKGNKKAQDNLLVAKLNAMRGRR